MGVARAVWGLAATLALGVLLASLPGYAVWLRGETPISPGPDPISGFHVLSGVASLMTALLCLGLALILFRQKRDEPMALYLSFYLMAYGVTLAGPLENLNTVFPGAIDLAIGLIQPALLGAPTIWLIILLPDGRPVPGWTRWVGGLSVANLVFLPFLDARAVATASTLPAQLMYATWLAMYLLAFGAQVYRYRRVSTPVQREQTRWVVFGLVTWIVLLILEGGPFVYVQNLPPGTPAPAWAAAAAAIWWLTLAIIPVTLTIAILLHRLYQIDLIINRTLVYGALTAILAGLYAASISLFQKAFIALTGQESDAAIVLTTLILASAFTPIKTRLQAIVDRRFGEVRDPLQRLTDFSNRVDGRIWVVDARVALPKLLEEAVAALDASGGEVVWEVEGKMQTLATHGEWSGESRLTIPLVMDGRVVGRIALGPRRKEITYTPEAARALSAAAEALARALTSASHDS